MPKRLAHCKHLCMHVRTCMGGSGLKLWMRCPHADCTGFLLPALQLQIQQACLSVGKCVKNLLITERNSIWFCVW